MSRPMPTFTKTPPAMVAAFDTAKPDDPRVTRRTMFGYPAYFVDGNMFAFTFGPRIAVRVDATRRAKAGNGGAAFEVMPGRPMREYVEVPAGATSGAPLRRWIADALAYTASLPAKGAPAKRTLAKKTAATRAAVKKTAATKKSAKRR